MFQKKENETPQARQNLKKRGGESGGGRGGGYKQTKTATESEGKQRNESDKNNCTWGGGGGLVKGGGGGRKDSASRGEWKGTWGPPRIARGAGQMVKESPGEKRGRGDEKFVERTEEPPRFA